MRSTTLDPGVKVVNRNKKAYFLYTIMDKYEAGMVLMGSEIKSIRNGTVNLKDGFVRIRGGEAFLENVHIGAYKQAGKHANHEPERVRKLLLHRREIDSILGRVERKGYTIVPLQMYIKENRAKVEIGLAKSKKKFEKKRDIIRRETEREDHAEMKRRSNRSNISGD